MSDPNQGPSNSASSSSSAALPKAIGSLAKKPDVTRQGTQKLKFVPTLPPRRKRDAEVKTEPNAPAVPVPTTSGRGRGHSEGRSATAMPRPPTEMTASGPFALGPTAMSRTQPTHPTAPTPRAPAPATKAEKGKAKEVEVKRERERGGEDEKEAYSDPDEGVEIVDMGDVKHLDWMAPDSLPRIQTGTRKRQKEGEVKQEGRHQADLLNTAGDEINLANALDLSESEEEDQLEDLAGDFVHASNDEMRDARHRNERLYVFQLPQPFPTFLPHVSSTADAVPVLLREMPPFEHQESGTAPDAPGLPAANRVSSTSDAIPVLLREMPPPPPPDVEKDQPKLDGVIGRLEVYKSGAVKMVLGNDIVLDVNSVAQPSFLQHAVHLDLPNKRLCVVGEVNKGFVISPNIDTLLASVDRVSGRTDEGLVKMDTT